MENYKVNKFIILFSVFLLVAGFIFISVYLLLKSSDESEKKEEKLTEETDNNSENEDYAWLYGKYINDKNSNSYLEITKNLVSFKKNVCEGYYVYDSDNYIYNEEIEKTDTGYSVMISLKIGNVEHKFSGEYIVGTPFILVGPVTCSESNIYVKEV